MGQKITHAMLQKKDEKDLQERSDKANKEIMKVLEKYEVALLPLPFFQQVEGSDAFVTKVQIRFASSRGVPKQEEKLAEG